MRQALVVLAFFAVAIAVHNHDNPPASPQSMTCASIDCGSDRDTDKTWDRRQNQIDLDRHGRTTTQDHVPHGCSDYGYGC